MKKKTTRERILIEAEKQFIKSGIGTTQMKEIAEAVNINRRTLYRYFPTKDELAFEVEIIVMKQIGEYLSVDMVETEEMSGYDKISRYFDKVNTDEIKEQMKFTAEFDRYFQDDYPTPQLEKTFVMALNPQKDDLYRFISEGCEDGSLRDDLSTDELYHFISQNFLALFQRLILRENHLKNEYCGDLDFQKVFKKIILAGIRKST